METTYKSKGSYADFKSGDYSNKEFVFELIKRNPEGGAVRSKETGYTIPFPLSKMIPMHGTIFYKEGNKPVYPRRIRYAQGEQSIFVDEQQPDDKFPKKMIKMEFIRGKFYVDGQNSTMLKFLMNWDMNESKEGRDPKKFPQFRLVDNSKKIEKARKDEDLVFDVSKWCREADWETKAYPLAQMIFTNPETLMQKQAEIRFDLGQVAKRDPAAFKRMLEDPKTERTIVIRAALEKGYVVKDSSVNGLFWADNGSLPLNAAGPGKDAIEDFVNKSFSGKGEELYKAVFDLVNPPEVYVAETRQEPRVIEAPILKECTDTDEELLMLIRTGVEKGAVLVKNNIWWKYRDDNSKGEAGFVAKLKDNPTMLKLLKADLGIE